MELGVVRTEYPVTYRQPLSISMELGVVRTEYLDFYGTRCSKDRISCDIQVM